jgi:protein involved in polysaccharide export with SLBB domain
MNSSILYTVGGLLLALLVGCKTPANNPPAFVPGGDAGAKSAAAPASGKPVTLTEQAFTVVASTNQIDPQWLQSPTQFFRLGPGDIVDIELIGEGASRATCLVGPDGKIYFGLLPGTFVWGLTLTEAKTMLEQQLKKYFRDQPLASVTLRAVNSQRVWILGGVQAPGVYSLDKPLSLLEAISLAGGTGVSSSGSDGADLPNSFVMRNGRPLAVDFQRLFRKGDLSQNIFLQSDDFVYLKPNAGQFVYVLGAVGRAGAVPLVNQTTVAAAISTSGGTIPYAQATEIAVLRGSLTNPRIASVNYKAIIKGGAPDVLLEPGDIVYVPFSPFRKIGEIAENLLKQFVSTVALNEGVRAVNRGASPIGVSVGLGGGTIAR